MASNLSPQVNEEVFLTTTTTTPYLDSNETSSSTLSLERFNPSAIPSTPKQHFTLIQNRTRNESSSFLAKSYLEAKGTTADELKQLKMEDGFRAIQRGAEAEDAKRYREALGFFIEGGEILCFAAEHESSGHVQDLVVHKSDEVIGWAERLSDWLEKEDKLTTDLPPRRAATVGLKPIGELVDTVNDTDIMRYTPVVTKNPLEFTQDGYQLECLLTEQEEKTPPSLMIVITMYNEDADQLRSTLRKVCNNIQYLTEHNLPGYEGEDAWRNVLVCIVSDGRKNANPDTLQYLHSIGLFDESAMNIASTGVDVKMHLFERVVHLQKEMSNKENLNFPPLQLMFALKEKNSGKLNSHLWFFNAFCAQVNPEYTCLLDVGTMPTKSAFYRLLWNMEINSQLGGVCGEIAVDKPIPNLGNFVIAAQHFEYKVSHLLDKAMESCFGYITVLPGAFSAYRYEAIQGAPLNAYFKSLTTPMSELGPFQGNMYLAEDRILAFELVAKKNCNWTMTYVKDAIARTDVPTNLTSLIAQRRRWSNGSFFAMLFGIMEWSRIYFESDHSWLRKFFFTIQYAYMIIQTFLNWFLPGCFFLGSYYVVVCGFSENNWGMVDLSRVPQHYKDLLSALFCGAYGITFYMQLIYGMGNKPKNLKKTYAISSIVLGILMLWTFAIVTLLFINTKSYDFFTIGFSVAVVGVYFIAALMHCELHHIVLTFLQYIAMLPTFVNILLVYSFCNLHDLSWGTKGLSLTSHSHHQASKENFEEKGTYKDVVARQKALDEIQKQEARDAETLKRRFDSFRSNLLLMWTVSNFFLVGPCIYIVKAEVFLQTIYIVLGLFNLFRFIGSAAYVLYLGRQWLLFQCFLRTGKLNRRYDEKKSMYFENKMSSFEHLEMEQTQYAKIDSNRSIV